MKAECKVCNGEGFFEDSNCCNAKIAHGICSACKEHCETSECDECKGTGEINEEMTQTEFNTMILDLFKKQSHQIDNILEMISIMLK